MKTVLESYEPSEKRNLLTTDIKGDYRIMTDNRKEIMERIIASDTK